MSLIYTRDHFHDGSHYSNYRRFEFFERRAEYLAGTLAAVMDDPILVAGCGWGYLLDELLIQGFTDVWGIDASEYAVQEALPRELPHLEGQILLGNVKSPDDLRTVMEAAGVDRFRAIITEDLLPNADSKSEAKEMVSSLREIGHSLIHIVTPRIEENRQSSEYLWLTIDEWRHDVIGLRDVVVDASWQ